MEYNKMRRVDKKLSDEKARQIIKKAKYGVLSLCDDNMPYGVPLSHAIDGNIIYFHCANEGLKLDIINKNPKGHFVFVSNAKNLNEKATVSYNSTMVYGSLRIIAEPLERAKAYKAIVSQYMKDFPDAAKKVIQSDDAKTTLVAMDIEGICAKGKVKKSKKSLIDISHPISIGNLNIKNRIVMPPLVLLNAKRKKGALTKSDYKHYAKRAKNDTGLIVVEATAVDKNGLSWGNGLRLWDDKHIEQYIKLTSKVKSYGCAIFVQLQHGGYKSNTKLTSPVSSSNYKDSEHKAKGLTEKQADTLVENFAQSALRAQKAGFDGIELHGCHGYLINQFSCPAINNRDDKYAKSSAFGVAIITRIKQLCEKDFIVSVRVGLDNPTIENSINTAIDYQNAGADMLSVSAGIDDKSFKAPDSWKHSDISYLAYLVKQKVTVPVIGVCGITDGKKANALLEKKYCDMVAVGRNHLIHGDWAKRALNDDKISKCRHCKKGCYFFGSMKKCPAMQIAEKKGY